jgi:hypothetical protein
MDVILAGLLTQNISLFRQTIDERPVAGHFHGTLVTASNCPPSAENDSLNFTLQMMRRCGLMSACSSWTPPNLSAADASQVDAEWRAWIAHESMKRCTRSRPSRYDPPDLRVCRLLTIAYVHDCFLNVFFSLPPSFFASELNWCLPAEDALWSAASSQEWYSLLQQPSRYGSAATRLTGLSMKAALAVLGDVRMPPTPGLMLPGFAHFVLINSTLSSIFCPPGAQLDIASERAPDHPEVLSGKQRDLRAPIHVTQLATGVDERTR